MAQDRHEAKQANTKGKSQTSQSILICDTNVVVKLFIFKSSIMFDASYTHGNIKVHQCVIDELNHWLKVKKQKYKKFGRDMIRGMIKAAAPKVSGLNSPDPATVPGKHRLLQNIESKIPDEERGRDTSVTDRDLLISAQVNNAVLATNEKTLTEVTERVLGTDRVVSFGDLVKDIYEMGVLSQEDVSTGYDNLIRFNERPEPKDRMILNKIARPGEENP